MCIIFQETNQWGSIEISDAGTGGDTAPPPIFGRLVNPILIGEGQIMPTNYQIKLQYDDCAANLTPEKHRSVI